MLIFDLQRFALDSYVVCYPYCPTDGTSIGEIKDLKGNTWSKTTGGQGSSLPIKDPGRYNIFFSAADDTKYAKMDQTISLGNKNFTIEGWAFMQSDSGHCARIFELSTGEGYVKRILFGQFGDGDGRGLVDLNDGYGSYTINNCIPYGTWFHFAIRKNA